MMKRVLAAVLCIFLLLCLWVPPASAAAVEGTCGESLTWTLDTDGTLTISGTGKMADFPAAAPWAAYREDITSVVLAEGVETIGQRAFADCAALTAVEMPGSLTSIGREAFFSCAVLTSLRIPKRVEKSATKRFTAAPR